MRETIANLKLLALYDYWDGKRSGRLMPSRSDIDVLELGPWLGHIALLDVLDDGRDYLFRVHGSELRQFSEMDLTGTRLLDLPYQWKHGWISELAAVVKTCKPLFVRRKSISAKDFIMISKLMLPLSDDGTAVNKIFYSLYREEVG